MDKQDILAQITSHLSEQLETLERAAKDTHEASTGENSKAEGKYDTRGLEASYLADAQAEQSQQLAEALQIIKTYTPPKIEADMPVSAGCLVETECNGTMEYFFLLPCAGGIVLDYDGADLTTLSPEAPLYQEMAGQTTGSLLETSDRLILDVF